MTDPLLSIRNLKVEFRSRMSTVQAVGGVDLDIYPGETVGIVGESGSGKSVTMLAAMGLLPRTARVAVSGQVLLRGQDLLQMRPRQLRQIRGRDMALIPQDPMTCLDPVLRVGVQLREALRVHQRLTRKQARARGIELLRTVGIPEPEKRHDQFPHAYSGGMRQRAMIAMGIANDPALLIADEPTTALDVTVQAQIMDVLRQAQQQTQACLALITHDLGLIAEMADRVVVMYAGCIVESGDVHTIFKRPRHPYTVGLMASLPQGGDERHPLVPIPGNPPDLGAIPGGCPFHPRCALAQGRERCSNELPLLRDVSAADAGHRSACHYFEEIHGSGQWSRLAQEQAS
ncbi:MAG: ABC transporter ATP-binding protein [Ottowia sp.]|nr:ABC transporter ATP-binding protein [Ottowia sp.]